MKFKLMEQTPIYIAGVVHHGSLGHQDHGQWHKASHKANDHVKWDNHGDFERDMAAIRANAQRIKDQVAAEMNFHFSDFEDKNNSEYSEGQGPIHGEAEAKISMEDAFDSLGKAVGNFGKFVEKNAPKWESGIKGWGQNFEGNMEEFGKKMEDWGEEFGSKMESWGDDLGKKMSRWGDSFGEKWEEFDPSMGKGSIESHPIYQTYEEVYRRWIKDHPNHIKAQTFYEVQATDTSFEHGTSMIMLGSRMDDLSGMRYPVATMTFEPDRWVAVKLSADEYAKDWFGSLEKVPQLKHYTLEPYFIIRHKKDGPKDEIRLFCPISEKANER